MGKFVELISFCVLQEENSGTVYSLDMDITFIFIKQKDKREMVKCKLCPGQKQLHDPANTTSHRQPAQMAF